MSSLLRRHPTRCKPTPKKVSWPFLIPLSSIA